jgi:hypothetical protein
VGLQNIDKEWVVAKILVISWLAFGGAHGFFLLISNIHYSGWG